MPKLVVNFHAGPNGTGELIEPPATFEGKGDGSDPVLQPQKLRKPRLAMSMTVQFDVEQTKVIDADPVLPKP